MNEVKPPSLPEQLKTLAEAVKNWTTKDGMKVVPPDVLEFRKNTCSSCEYWDKEAFGVGRCKVCGCTLAKLYMPSSSCPLNPPKWKTIQLQGEEIKEIDTPRNPNLRLPLRVVGKTEATGSVS